MSWAGGLTQMKVGRKMWEGQHLESLLCGPFSKVRKTKVRGHKA